MAEQKYTLLSIDDDAAVRESMKLVFGEEYEVLTAASGKDALEIIRKRKIDLVLLDIRMPEMRGTEVIKKIREISEDLKVMPVTAIYDVETCVEMLQYGAMDYILKPFDVAILKSKVREFLERK